MTEHDSARRWDESQGGTERVKAVLRRSGFPLELRAARIAEDFANSVPANESQTTFRAPLYFRDRKGAPREFDGLVSLRQKFGVNNVTFHLEFQTIIECKHRENVAWFAFDVHREPGKWYTNLLPPIVSNASLLPMLSLYASEREHLQMPEYRLSTLEFVNGDPKVVDEPQTMKVAAAAFDYLAALVGRMRRTYPFTAPVALEGLKLQQRFEKFKNGSQDPVQAQIARFLGTLDASDHNRYLEAISKSAEQSVSFLVVLPILCVNGPMRIARVDTDGNIERFDACQFAATRLHLEQWPGHLISRVVQPASGFPLLVTSIDTLHRTLEYVHGMFNATSYTLRQLVGSPHLSSMPLNIAASNVLLDYEAARAGEARAASQNGE